uniref:F-box protein 27 n=1 Tax=Panthera tigris altaica TaxID=74533 RepID=A0A8C9JGM5_PANTA
KSYLGELASVQTPLHPSKSRVLTLHLLPPTFPPYKRPIHCQVSFPGIKIQPVAGQKRGGMGANSRFFFFRTEGLWKWMVKHSGNSWVVEVNRSTVPGAPSQTCFVSSFSWCRKKQVLDLEEEGLWPELLDSGKIEICVSDWWGARHDSGCMYRLLVQLLDANQTVLDKFSAMPVPIQQWNNNVCFQVTHVFSDIKIGVRFVSFEHWGQDTQFWAGHYGARVTNSSVVVRARLS